ncbi:hypothetical protein [Aquabacter spiritensis]|uniref:hypothetical protein n=1 Tax=Aquabacter spiritensis TaxID=933073 RepID=UPI0010500FC2|nr:hypothetical protein [Aquabacter spiritensis]
MAQSLSRVDEFRAHPQFLTAFEQCARGLVQMYRGNRILNRILNDRGRVAFGVFALYLDAMPDENGVGLTVTRIANLCQEQGVCSRGRAKAMVLLMRWAGYLETGPESGPNRRQRPLLPTPRLMAEHIKRWQHMYGALSLIDPVGEQVLLHIEERAFARALLRQVGHRFQAGMRILHHAPEASLFAERDAGLLIAMSLLISRTEDDVFPPRNPVPVPVAALARQFFVSRAHVLKLLREAESEGLIVRTPSASGNVQLAEPMRRAMTNFFLTMFSVMADAARAAVAEYEAQADLRDDRHPVRDFPAIRFGQAPP